MKYIISLIPAAALNRVTAALGRAGVYRLTVGEVEVIESREGAAAGDPRRRLRLEVAVNDSFLEPALEALRLAAGGEAEFSVVVLSVEEAVRIRTDERGSEAI